MAAPVLLVKLDGSTRLCSEVDVVLQPTAHEWLWADVLLNSS